MNPRQQVSYSLRPDENVGLAHQEGKTGLRYTLYSRRVVQVSVLAAVASFLLSAIPNLVIAKRYDKYIHRDLREVPKRGTALVLGTSKYANGRLNPYYQGRVQAAAELYASGKVRRLLVSGDRSRQDYNEPLSFKQDLIRRGVPAADIILDYAGFRTLDSIVRAKEVFGLDGFIIVSQAFHCERALFIAHNRGIDAIGYVAREVLRPVRYRVMLREYLARVKAGIDVWLINKEPKYLDTTLRSDAVGLWLRKEEGRRE